MSNELISIVMGIFFALSGLFFGISQDYNSRASNILLLNTIHFELNSNLINKQLISQILLNTNLIGKDIAISSTNLICSATDLYGKYGDYPTPNQTVIQYGINQCTNLSSLEEYSQNEESLINLSTELKNLSKSLQILNKINNSLDMFNDLQNKSELYQNLGWVFFIFGFATPAMSLLISLYLNRKRINS
jgi:hypothetical protein